MASARVKALQGLTIPRLCSMSQRELRRRLVASAKPMCTFYKVLNQRVDWVAWASIQIYGARDAIDDVCTTSSGSVLFSLDLVGKNDVITIEVMWCTSEL